MRGAIILVVVNLLVFPSSGAEEVAANFRLLDRTGVSHELYRIGASVNAVLLYVMPADCPDTRQDLEQLAAFGAAHGNLRVFVVDPAAASERNPFLEVHLAKTGLTVLEDTTQWVTRSLGLSRAGAFVAETQQWKVLYRGALPGPTEIETLLRSPGPAAAVRGPESGCTLNLRPLPTAVSYDRDIAPILLEHCAPCHRPGGIAPFALSSHAKVRGWSDMIREVLLTQRMPPWFADPHHGVFANDRRLSGAQQDLLLSWLDAGAPSDVAGEDPLKSVAQQPASEWPLGPPDMIVELPADQRIPAEGVFDYRYIEVACDIPEDKWVRAADLHASNRNVTHHAVAFVNYPASYTGERFDDEGGLNGYFALYVPGAAPQPYPENTGKFLPAGATFVFGLHYTATGKQETDRTRMGLYFHKEKPAQELVTRAAANTALYIEPGDPDSETEAMKVIDRDVILWGLSPHMHYRGKRMRYEAEYPDGRREVLLSVPNYQFDWQLLYQLKEPKPLPAGTLIHVTGAYDNSALNPYNPDPARAVEFGEQSFEEMFIAYMNYSYDPAQAPAALAPEEAGVLLTETSLPGTEWYFGSYHVRFESGGALKINDNLPATWRLEGRKLLIQVDEDEYAFDIQGQHITSSQMPVRRAAAQP